MLPPGWYADPSGRFEYRFHNGSTWTADVSSGGQRFVDPLGRSPTPPASVLPRAHDRRNATAWRSAVDVLGIVAISIAWMPFIVVVG